MKQIRSGRPTGRGNRRAGCRLAMLGLAGSIVAGAAAQAQSKPPTVEDLMRKIEELQRRVDQLEGRRGGANKPAVAARTGTPSKPVGSHPSAQVKATPPRQESTIAVNAPAAADTSATIAQPSSDKPAPDPFTAAFGQKVAGLMAPEPMGSQFENEDALRSDLPGLSIRIPGLPTEVRLYGFAKLSTFYDLSGRNQNDAPPPQTIPLNNSAATQQGGEFGMTARFSRIGVDTRTLTGWGTLETRLEGDFAGGSATSNNAVFRLRQAWAELGDESFRVLIGQANSLWNEGVFETLIDATNLNQSFIRQAQIRATGRLAPGLTGMISLEAPDTQYTSVAGVFTPGSTVNGGASPAFNAAPDLLGRITYRDSGFVADMRAMVRHLSVRTVGTNATPGNLNLNTTGWGLAGHVTIPMRWLWDGFGSDTLSGMVYYGQGMGRYFAGNTSGQDALTNIGLPGVIGGSLDPLPAYGVVASYRRFWTPKLRSNFAYSYARQDYPSYALQFTPGSPSALGLNRDMQQAFVNLIWSPFGSIRNGVFNSGFIDLGLEYIFTRRDLFGGSASAGNVGAGEGIAHRIVGAAVGRF